MDGTAGPGPVALATALSMIWRLATSAATIPVTIPVPGADRPLPKPVYRAYDVKVAFNED